MKLIILVLLLFVCDFYKSQGIYAPPVGQVGTTAIHKDSIVFVNWASSCVVTRGYKQINNTSLGYASVGANSDAIGQANGSVVSLGDSGIAILQFTTPIYNGTGYDFAVFENAFNHTFLELAFVEVSSDGVNFFRFNNYSTTQDTLQIGGFGSVDATNIHNLAGKYKVNYGTPFDLDEVPNNILLNKNAITHVKIIDVIGNVSTNSTYDSDANKVNDPWPTPYASSGFDLDAIGVINESTLSGIKKHHALFSIYPNPAKNTINILTDELFKEAAIYSLSGSLMLKTNKTKFDLSSLTKGMYLLKIKTNKGVGIKKIIKN